MYSGGGLGWGFFLRAAKYGHTPILRRQLCPVAVLLATILSGCGSPNQANIQLRKDNQALVDQVDGLKRDNDGLQAQLQANQNSAASPQLPQSRLDQLFTAHGLTIAKLTGGYSPDDSDFDKMVKVYVVPTDDQGQDLKAAGSYVVELFDLAESDTRLGRWEFPTEVARNDWYDQMLLYNCVLDCPWQKIPKHAHLHLTVTFTDELTGRQFSAERDIEVRPPK